MHSLIQTRFQFRLRCLFYYLISSILSSCTYATLSPAVITQNITLVGNATLSCFTSTCSPSIQLTPATARVTGAAWTRKRMEIRDGFETTFTIQLSQHSQTCPFFNGIVGVSNTCVTRGGHGLAFVVVNVNDTVNATTHAIDTVIGEGGNGIGYQGINNSLAIEFDTWYNDELEDPYDNHIAIQSRGSSHPNSNHHQYALGTTTAIPDLMDERPHTIKLVYDPLFDERFIHPTYCVDNMSCGLLQSMQNLGGLFQDGLLEQGVGTMSVYIDTLTVPSFIAPVQLESMLQLTNGTAYMGFTASTGITEWQIHSISNWSVCTYKPRSNNSVVPDTAMPSMTPYSSPRINTCTTIT